MQKMLFDNTPLTLVGQYHPLVLNNGTPIGSMRTGGQIPALYSQTF